MRSSKQMLYSRPMAKVLVVGSSNYDLVWRTARVPARGETVAGTSFATFMGGKGANQAVAAGRLGASVAFCGSFGTDSFGDEMLLAVSASGVDVSFVRRSRLPSGTASVVVEESGSNQIVVALGANMDLQPADVLAALQSLQPEYVLAQLEVPLDAVEAAASSSARFVLNPAPAAELPASLLARCFALVPNETEIATLVPGRSASEAAKSLLDKGVENVILTLGERGVEWVSATGTVFVPSHKVVAVDTVAAGDVFCGAFVTGLSAGKPMEEALRYANAAAAISVTRHGAQASAPYPHEVEKMLSTSPL